MLDWVGRVLGWARQMLRRVGGLAREQKKGKREKRGERSGDGQRGPRQYLTVILTLFYNFNSLNHDSANLGYGSKLQESL